MNHTLPSKHWTVADILDRCPDAAAVFTKHRMACVGCPMASFDTLSDAAKSYRLDAARLLREIDGALGIHNRGR